MHSQTLLSLNSSPQKLKELSIIKIKSPKSDIKVHNPKAAILTKISPELTAKENATTLLNDEVDRITQRWNNLKVTALSKAIAMAPDVGSCTLGPKQSISSFGKFGDEVESEKLDLSKAVTSTPMKPHPFNRSGTRNNNMNTFNIKESAVDSSLLDEESRKLDTLRKICLERIEAYINNHVQKKRDHILKSWEVNSEKINQMSLVLRAEIENERKLRIQEQNTAVQKILMKTEENAQSKAQQQQQIKVDQEKRLAETGEKLRQIEQKKKEVEEKRKKRHKELKQCIDRIYEMHVAYNNKYCQIHEINKKCNDIHLLGEKVAGELPKIKAMNELMLKIVQKSNEGKVSQQDLMTAESLVQQISIITELFAQSVDEVNKSLEKANEEKKKQEIEKENEIKRKQEEAVQQQKLKAKEDIDKNKAKRTQSPNKLSSGVEDCISDECLKWHLELSRFLEEYEENLQPFINNDSLKPFRVDCQKQVNLPVNAISAQDDLHLQDKLYKLSRLLEGKPTPKGNTMFFITGHPMGIPFCKNLLAEKFVKQGEQTVSSNPEAAFAMAAVIVALWADFPEFGRLLIAHFHRECPYLIPAFLPQVEGQSDEDYYRMLGYQYSEDGKVESQDKFLRRMSGVMRLYAAILVTPLKRSQRDEGKQHPLNIKEGWRWLTASLNLSPRCDISATLLFDFLDVAGSLMLKTYRGQFTKIVQFLCTDYLPKIEQETRPGCGGPVTRLKNFLERILKEGQVAPPPGLLPPNFW